MSSKIIGRVIVGIDGSPGSLQALRYALGQARLLEATLIPVLAWQLPGGELAARRTRAPEYTRVLRERAEHALLQAFDEALGGLPAAVRAEPRVIHGEAGSALVQTANRVNDLLVIGAGRRGRLSHALGAATARHCLARAVCPVIAVPPPTLQSAIPSQLRLRRDTDRLLDERSRAH